MEEENFKLKAWSRSLKSFNKTCNYTERLTCNNRCV